MNLYFVKSKDGKYFRSRGWGGYGDQWVDSLEKAKGYAKKGTAKAQASYWFKHYPEYGCPTLVECEVVVRKEIDLLSEFNADNEKKVKAAVKKANKLYEEFEFLQNEGVNPKLVQSAAHFFNQQIDFIRDKFPKVNVERIGLERTGKIETITKLSFQ